MDLCLLLLLVLLLLLHSLCQCDLPHWLLFRLRGLLRPLGLALWVKKASILSPLLKSTTQQAAQCPGTAIPRPELPPAASSSLSAHAAPSAVPAKANRRPRARGLSLEIVLQANVKPPYLKYSLLCSDFIIITMFNNAFSYTKRQRGFTSLFKSFFLPGLHVNYGVRFLFCLFNLFFFLRDIHIAEGAKNCEGWKKQANTALIFETPTSL